MPGSVVVVSLGFDTYGLDPIGVFALTTDVYHEIGRRTAALGRRLVILQEGGYHRPSLGENARAWLRGAEGRPFDPLPAAGFGPSVARSPARVATGDDRRPLTPLGLAAGGRRSSRRGTPTWRPSSRASARRRCGIAEPGFGTLLHIVLEQQVSLASAQAAFDRLRARRRSADPGALPRAVRRRAAGHRLQPPEGPLRPRPGRRRSDRARSTSTGSRASMTTPSTRALQAIPGIGPWTSTIYLLMVLGRPDVWPVGDIALAASVGEVKGLGHRPDARRDGRARRGLAAVAVGRGAPVLARLPRPDAAGRAERPVPARLRLRAVCTLTVT